MDAAITVVSAAAVVASTTPFEGSPCSVWNCCTADSVPVPVIASGGVGNLDHLVDGIRKGHATAVLAASIFHFGEFTIREAKDHMVRAGLPMRLDP